MKNGGKGADKQISHRTMRPSEAAAKMSRRTKLILVVAFICNLRTAMNSYLFSEYRVDLGILILRVAVGAVMFTHGLLKPLVFTLPGTMEFFEKNGFPGWTAIPVFILELVCGGFLIVGLLSRWAAAALIPVMIGALMVHWPHGWMFDRQGGGWEYIAFLTAALLSLVVLGDGRFSLDTLILHGSEAFHRQFLRRVERH
jgi:putative oxidoreductase